MRWNCDKRKEKKAEKLAEKIVQRSKWHRYFAWWPVKIHRGLCVWLEFYEIRAECQWPRGYNQTYYFKPGNVDALTVAKTCVFNSVDLNVTWARRVIGGD